MRSEILNPTSPGGADTNIQINDGGVFNGFSNFIYNKTTGQFTQAIVTGQDYTFKITGDNTTKTGSGNSMNTFWIDLTHSWTGAGTGTSPLRAMYLSFIDSRIINSASSADYARVMDFYLNRTSTYSSVQNINYLMSMFMQTSDDGTYSNINPNVIAREIWISGCVHEPFFTGSGSGTVEWSALYIDQPAILSSDATSLASIYFNCYGVYCKMSPSAGSGAAIEQFRCFGLYYATVLNSHMNYALYAITGHQAMATDGTANKGKIQLGAGTNAQSSTVFYSPDVEIYFDNTVWQFDCVQQTTNMITRFNKSQLDNDFQVSTKNQANTLYIDGNLDSIGIRLGRGGITAYLHIAAGTATANTAPIKLTAGTNLTTPEAGAIEFDGSFYYFTV